MPKLVFVGALGRLYHGVSPAPPEFNWIINFDIYFKKFESEMVDPQLPMQHSIKPKPNCRTFKSRQAFIGMGFEEGISIGPIAMRAENDFMLRGSVHL